MNETEFHHLLSFVCGGLIGFIFGSISDWFWPKEDSNDE